MTPGRFEWNLRSVIFKLILMIGGWNIFSKIALKWMSLDLIDDKSTLVQVMAWCHQATSHYPSQCWTRSVSPYGVTRPQWVKCNPGDLLTSEVLRLCNIRYPFETRLKPKSREIPFVHNLFLSKSIVLKFCTGRDSDPVVLCTTFENNRTTQKDDVQLYHWLS